MAEVTRGFRFTPAWMRELGVTRANLLKHLQAMDAAGELPATAEELDMTHAAKVGSALLAECPDARCEADGLGADWAAFFEAVLAFIAQLMPFIIKKRVTPVQV